MTNEELQKLKDAGIEDAVIQSIIAEDAAKQGNAQVTAPVAPDLPEIDVTQKSDTLKNAEAAGVPTSNEGSLITDVAALGAAAAPYALPAAGAGLGLYGAAKVGGWGREIGKGVQSMAEAQRASAAAQQQANAIQAAREARLMNRPGFGGVPTGGPVGASPVSGPIAPPMGAAANEANIASRVQQAAAANIKNLPPATMMGNVGKFAGRVLPGAGTVLNAADAYNRYNEGDYLGAGLAGIGAAASPFPVVGTAVGMGTAGINAYRDYLKRNAK